MIGAKALLRTLGDGGVTTCFTNPGTSEMHFVAALDAEPRMRAVLTLFEGVASGAADGYARMTDRPAATLLHLGPGLGNALANLHNARRAQVPLVNIVGDHATYHRRHDAQLQSDIETVARNVSRWVRTSQSPEAIGADAADAIAASLGPPGEVVTLILPADVSWSEGATPAPVPAARPRATPDGDAIEAIAAVLRTAGGQTGILLGGRALRDRGLAAAARVAAASGARLVGETFPTRLRRGAGVPSLDRLAYLPELAAVQLAGLRHLILVDARAPVTFFAYPDRESSLVPPGCDVHELAGPADDAPGALEALAELLGAASARVPGADAARPGLPTGSLTAERVCAAIGALLPEGAIVSDESQTSGVTLAAGTSGAPAHDVLTLTGGSIGQGLPVAVGAAIACPDRPVFALEADGSSLYTIQSLWTMAREQLDVTTVIFNNGAYAILELELQRVGAEAGGEQARAQLDLSRPKLDFVALGNGLGVPSRRADGCEELAGALRTAAREPGPHLIEVAVPRVFSPRRLRAMPYALRALGALPQPVAAAIKRRVYP